MQLSSLPFEKLREDAMIVGGLLQFDPLERHDLILPTGGARLLSITRRGHGQPAGQP
jgi:hypothetical protein